MIWGIIALFVLVTVWGLVAFIQNNLQIYPIGGPQNVPILNLQGGGSSGGGDQTIDLNGGGGSTGGGGDQTFSGGGGNTGCGDGIDENGNELPPCR
jgi:hypothetical protein